MSGTVMTVKNESMREKRNEGGWLALLYIIASVILLVTVEWPEFSAKL